MNIKIKGLTSKAIRVLIKFGKMKQRGVINVFDEDKKTLIMTFPKLRNKENLIPSYKIFIAKTLGDKGLKSKEYEIDIQ